MTKTEYRKKSNTEKKLNYKLRFFGGLIALLGLIIVLISFFAISDTSYQILGFGAGAIVAFVGLIIDISGEVMLLNEYGKNESKQ